MFVQIVVGSDVKVEFRHVKSVKYIAKYVINQHNVEMSIFILIKSINVKYSSTYSGTIIVGKIWNEFVFI